MLGSWFKITLCNLPIKKKVLGLILVLFFVTVVSVCQNADFFSFFFLNNLYW